MSVEFLENLAPYSFKFHFIPKNAIDLVKRGLAHSDIPNYSLSADDSFGGWGYSDRFLIRLIMPLADSGDGEV